MIILFSTEQGIKPDSKTTGQAIAAARADAKVVLIGKSSNDEAGAALAKQLKQEGITISGTAEDNGNVLNKKSFLLTQTELPLDENISLLTKAKKAEATTIMNLSPSINLSQKALDQLDYLIVNFKEAGQLAEKIGLNIENNALKLAEGLSKQGNLTCIITIGAQGSVAYTQDNIAWKIQALSLDEIVDHAGAEEAYCGVFAACLQANMPLPRAMKRASLAGSLACSKSGRIESLPTLEELESRINDLDDPEEVDC